VNLRKRITIASYASKEKGGTGLVSMGRTLLDTRRKPLRVNPRIFHVHVEPTVRCNLRCPLCPASGADRRTDDLSYPRFVRLLDHFPSLHYVILQGMGEPFLNRELCKMIRHAKERFCYVETFTNGMSINASRVDEILQSDLDELHFSVDGATPEALETARPGADLKRIVDTVERLIEKKGGRTWPVVDFWFVYTNKNLGELPGLVSLAGELGIPKIHIQRAHDWSSTPIRERMERFRSKAVTAEAKAIYERAQDLAKRYGVFLRTLNPPDEGPPTWDTREARCTWPWRSCYITADGFVTPCCVRPDPEVTQFGNLFRDDFSAIWNGSDYIDLRRRLKSGPFPELCRGCPDF